MKPPNEPLALFSLHIFLWARGSGIGFIKTTYDISLDSQISLLRPADSLSILDL